MQTKCTNINLAWHKKQTFFLQISKESLWCHHWCPRWYAPFVHWNALRYRRWFLQPGAFENNYHIWSHWIHRFLLHNKERSFIFTGFVDWNNISVVSILIYTSLIPCLLVILNEIPVNKNNKSNNKKNLVRYSDNKRIQLF